MIYAGQLHLPVDSGACADSDDGGAGIRHAAAPAVLSRRRRQQAGSVRVKPSFILSLSCVVYYPAAFRDGKVCFLYDFEY